MRLHPRVLASFPLVLLAFGCGGGGSGADGGPDASECVPVTHVCVTDEFGMPSPEAAVTATREGEIPFQGTTGSDGCVDLYPTDGDWALQGRTTRNCQNEPVTHTVSGCGRTEVALAATQCFDG